MKQKYITSPLIEMRCLLERLDKNLSYDEAEEFKKQYALNESNKVIEHQPDDEELMFYCLVPQKIINNIGLDVYLDENKMYIQDNHPLWLYVQNGINSNEYIAFTISNNPIIANGIQNIKLNSSEISTIKYFILSNKKIIEDIANGNVRSYKIFKEIIDNELPLQMAESKQILNEMAVIGREDTGLPVDIWLEFTRTPKQHSLYRFKFQAEQGETNTRNWPTIIFGNTPVEVINMPKKSFLKGKDIKALKVFAEKYKEELKKLSCGEIDVNNFIELINNDKINLI